MTDTAKTAEAIRDSVDLIHENMVLFGWGIEEAKTIISEVCDTLALEDRLRPSYQHVIGAFAFHYGCMPWQHSEA